MAQSLCLFFYHWNKNAILNIRGQAFDHICRIKAFIHIFIYVAITQNVLV